MASFSVEECLHFNIKTDLAPSSCRTARPSCLLSSSLCRFVSICVAEKSYFFNERIKIFQWKMTCFFNRKYRPWIRGRGTRTDHEWDPRCQSWSFSVNIPSFLIQNSSLFNTKYIIFNTNVIIRNTKSIIFNTKVIIVECNSHHCSIQTSRTTGLQVSRRRWRQREGSC